MKAKAEIAIFSRSDLSITPSAAENYEAEGAASKFSDCLNLLGL